MHRARRPTLFLALRHRAVLLLKPLLDSRPVLSTAAHIPRTLKELSAAAVCACFFTLTLLAACCVECRCSACSPVQALLAVFVMRPQLIRTAWIALLPNVL